MRWALFFRRAAENCFFRRATQMSTFFQMTGVKEHLLSRWASRSTSYQMNNVIEHKLSSKSSRFYFWNCLNSMATGAQSWAQRRKADEQFFSDEQKCWALFFSWASLGEHHSSEEQDEKSTFFRWAPEMSTVFFRRATQLSTFSQMRKVGEHLLSSWASRMLSKVDEHNFSSKPSRFYIWKYLNTVATDAQSWAQMSKRVVHFFFSWAKKVWSYFHQMSRTR